MTTSSSPLIPVPSTRDSQVEDPDHIEALAAHKRAARKHRAIDRLHHAAPSAKELFLRAGQRAHHLGVLTRRLGLFRGWFLDRSAARLRG